MTNLKWVCDPLTKEVITWDEYQTRLSQREKVRPGNFEYKQERGHWKLVNGKLVSVSEKSQSKEVSFVVSDEIAPTVSHATDEGKVFTSKRALRAHYREHGCIEVGGEKATPVQVKRYVPDPKEIRDTVTKALNDLRWGNVPISEREKELCKQEMRKLEQYRRNH
jgi:hypothetical protein